MPEQYESDGLDECNVVIKEKPPFRAGVFDEIKANFQAAVKLTEEPL